jgi:hypothetical protein
MYYASKLCASSASIGEAMRRDECNVAKAIATLKFELPQILVLSLLLLQCST